MNILQVIYRWFLSLVRKPKLAEGKFGTGCVPQPQDTRDYTMSFGAGAFDWTTGYDVEDYLSKLWNVPFKIKSEDQDGSSSCVSQATSTYASVLNYVERGVWNKLSAHDVYCWIYLGGGGAYLRDGVKRIVDYGVLPETEFSSYDNGVPPSESFMRTKPKEVPNITDFTRDLFKSVEYISIPATIDELAKAISLHHGLILGVNGSNNGTWSSVYPKPPVSKEWGHALYGGKAKMVGGKKYIGVKNSWGNVGEDGWQWLGEEWFSPSNVFDGWVLSDRVNQIDREADFEKLDKIVRDPGHVYPQPDHSPYTDVNWAHVLSVTGVSGITWGTYYDWAMVTEFRKKYGI